MLSDRWISYQEAVGRIIREQHEERRLLLLWLGYVEATHRDAYTMEFLTRALRLGNWYPALIEFARQMSDVMDAEAMAS